MNGNSGPDLWLYAAVTLKYLISSIVWGPYTTFPYSKIGHTNVLYSVINKVLSRVLKHRLISARILLTFLATSIVYG